MGIIESRTFKSGNSVAVRLPKELGFEAGTAITIEKVGDRLEIKPAVDMGDEARQMRELVDEIKAIWKDAPDHPDRGRRDPIEFPERKGL